MSLIPDLNWRYATKKYDTAKKVSQRQLDEILEAISLAPSGSGYQPYDVLVVTNPEVREKLRAAANNQSQVTEASHLLVFAAWDNITAEKLGKVFDNMALIRGKSDSLDERRKGAIAGFEAKSAEENFHFAAQQAFIGLGVGVSAAAALKVDATPMGGFDPKKFDEILGLKAKGLRSVVILPIGHRHADGDWLVNLKKVRRPKNEMFIEVA
ncbi:NAD(P)H-dependent oxidoreductase [Aestuariivirga litoralis]|uniref:NAD(P)H-dependent oxidoreductase n=1 Tax=Aestuariivirga litoralis TaxID=2650924 RepID=UPI0018C71BC7|nr:NAD(P)H-dependent oxidoreductase [Aestuariivirga litoralis]MBG1233368.1 NAD(P)H-dependent oxidoreductase [Aestuariivirga litoralis]